jgi:hypothetical protein
LRGRAPNPGKAPSRQLPFSLLVPFKSQDALAGNHLELSLLVPPADIATVDSHGKRPIGSRKFVPAPLAALDETELFLAHFLLQPLRYIRDVLANGECIDGLVDRQHVLQEFQRHPVAHERGPLGLQEKQLGQRVVRQQLSQWAERLGFMRSACSTVQPRSSPRERAEDGAERERVITLAATRLAPTILGQRPQLAVEFSPVEPVWLEILVGFHAIDRFAQFVQIADGVAVAIEIKKPPHGFRAQIQEIYCNLLLKALL